MDPYPEITGWAIPRDAVAATLDAVRPRLHTGVEAGVLWLGPRRDVARVDAVVIPRGVGVEATSGCWRVTPEVFGQIGAWSDGEDLSLLAVCHTHGGPSPASLSLRDRTHSIKVPGVLAIVIGRDGDEPKADRWGWYVWRDGDYDILTRATRSRLLSVTNRSVSVWRADAAGVYPV